MTSPEDKPNTGEGNGMDAEKVAPGTSRAKEKRRSLRPPLSVLREVIMRNGGICSGVAAACGVADRTARSWRERDPVVGEVFDEARERIVDMAEGVIVKSLKAGNLTAAIYVTKCHGWKRGWVEKHDREEPYVDPRAREEKDSMLRTALGDPATRKAASALISSFYKRPPMPEEHPDKEKSN